MIKDLISLANELDTKGLQKEADELDSIITLLTKDAGSCSKDYADDTYSPSSKPDVLSRKDPLGDDEYNYEKPWLREFLREDNDPSDEDLFLGDFSSSESSQTPEEKLLNLIRGSEEMAKRLGLTHSETEMTPSELESHLREVLNLEGLSDEEMDSVLTLAADLLSSPMKMLGGTPRVRMK
tara:strand:- start:2697 stop:3239 length:543 start_codon:yes stop_codon:yes gene_type:complete